MLVPNALLVVYSLWRANNGVIVHDWTITNYRQVFSSELIRVLLWRTLYTALGAALLATFIAYPLAYFVTRRLGRHRLTAALLILVRLAIRRRCLCASTLWFSFHLVIQFSPLAVTECAPIFGNLPPAITDATPRTMEKYDQGHGCILYRTTIPVGPARMAPTPAASMIWFRLSRRSAPRCPQPQQSVLRSSFPRATSPRHWTFWSRQWAELQAQSARPKRHSCAGETGRARVRVTDKSNLPLDDKEVGGLKFSNMASGFKFSAAGAGGGD